MAELMNTINNNVNHYTKNRSPYDTIEYFNQSTLTSNIDISNKVEIYNTSIDKKNSYSSFFLKSGATLCDVGGHFFSSILDKIDQIIDGTAVFVVGNIAIPAFELLGSLDLGEISIDLNSLSMDDGISSNAVNGTIELSVDTSNFKNIAEELQQGVTDFIDKDLFESFDKKLENCEFINNYSTASDNVIKSAEDIGKVASDVAVSLIPGKVGMIVTYLAGAGKGYQRAIDKDASYNQAMISANSYGVLGMLTKKALGNIGKSAKVADGVLGKMFNYGKGGAVGSLEAVANCVIDYFSYGITATNDDGSLTYGASIDGFEKFAEDNNLSENAVLGFAVGSLRTVIKSLDPKIDNTGVAKKTVEQAVKRIVKEKIPDFIETVKEYGMALFR